MDFATITGTTAGSIVSWLNHPALSTVGTQIVQEAESWIYPRLRHWQMLTSTSGTMTASATTISVPSDFLEDKRFKFTGTAAGSVTRKTIQEVVDAMQYDGNGNRVAQKPRIMFNDKDNLQFDSPSDQAYPFTLWYYARPAALSTSNNTNFITNNYPRLMRTTSCFMAAEYMKDSGQGNYDRSYWEAEAQKELDAAQAESDKHERSIEQGAIMI